MKTRRLGAIGECEARTQRRVRSRRLRIRPRTTHRAAERGQWVECFVLLEVLYELGTLDARAARRTRARLGRRRPRPRLRRPPHAGTGARRLHPRLHRPRRSASARPARAAPAQAVARADRRLSGASLRPRPRLHPGDRATRRRDHPGIRPAPPTPRQRASDPRALARPRAIARAPAAPDRPPPADRRVGLAGSGRTWPDAFRRTAGCLAGTLRCTPDRE